MIYGITGPARSGKDTLANLLVNRRGFTRVALADPLRVMVATLTGMTFQQMLDSPEKELPHPRLGGVSPRRAMQTLGTEWGRDLVWNNLWIEHAMDKAQAADGPVVIPDVRFENEAAAVRARGGKVIHMVRPGAAAVEGHISEAGVAFVEGDVVVLNDGDMDDLKRHVLEMFGHHGPVQGELLGD